MRLCYPHPSADGLIWLLKFYNIFVFLLFPQRHDTFTTVPSQNILDEATKIFYFRPHPNTTLVDQSKLTTFPQETTLNFSLLILALGFGMEKQTRAGEDRAWASQGHLDRKLICVVPFFLLRVMCSL